MTLLLDAQAVSNTVAVAMMVILFFILNSLFIKNIAKKIVILHTQILTKIVPNF